MGSGFGACPPCHFNPRSPHGERPYFDYQDHETASISTHAPRTGSDANNFFQQTLQSISTHAPRTGSDGRALTSTRFVNHFNPRSPHGERLPVLFALLIPKIISTHAPRTGSDLAADGTIATATISTHAPRTGSDARLLSSSTVITISTHAPRTGSDTATTVMQPANYISTHAPRTGSDVSAMSALQSRTGFQPTLPARGATMPVLYSSPPLLISTHAPRTGSDVSISDRLARRDFNPRSPHGERRALARFHHV